MSANQVTRRRKRSQNVAISVRVNHARISILEWSHRWALRSALMTFIVAASSTPLPGFAYHRDVPSLERRRRLCGQDLSQKSASVSRVVPLFGASSDDFDDGEDGKDDIDERLRRMEGRMMKRVIKLEQLVAKQEVDLDRLKRKSDDLEQVSKIFISVIEVLQEDGFQQTSSNKETQELPTKSGAENSTETTERIFESFDDEIIFGTAPSSVMEAADSAGAAILSAILAGKHRMLVDVRDAELSTDYDNLVQFIELAILPVAAGLTGLATARNRVKIVFPKVAQLLEFRRTMVLAAPEVVALSTLGFDPVEKKDKIVVLVVPEPDDEEGLKAMRELLYPSTSSQPIITQPVVILNYHMVPVASLPIQLDPVYHLRLLTVHYMTGEEKKAREDEEGHDKDALEAAMRHASEVGVNQGVTRAMVIRAYPRPWHVFVDTSPHSDADFEVAATFDEEPSVAQLNRAIVECLEGSEREEEIVTQQMQQALEAGQLDRVSDMIGEALSQEDSTDDDLESNDPEDDSTGEETLDENDESPS